MPFIEKKNLSVTVTTKALQTREKKSLMQRNIITREKDTCSRAHTENELYAFGCTDVIAPLFSISNYESLFVRVQF